MTTPRLTDAQSVRLARWAVAWWTQTTEERPAFDRFDAELKRNWEEYRRARAEHNAVVDQTPVYAFNRLRKLSNHEMDVLDPWLATLEQQQREREEWKASFNSRMEVLKQERDALTAEVGELNPVDTRPDWAYQIVAQVGMRDPEPRAVTPAPAMTYPAMPDPSMPPPPDYGTFEAQAQAHAPRTDDSDDHRNPAPNAASLDDIF